MAGYRPAPPKPTAETWVEYLARARSEVKLYLEERRGEEGTEKWVRD